MHQKYYVVRILGMSMGKTAAGLGSQHYNNGHGAASLSCAPPKHPF